MTKNVTLEKHFFSKIFNCDLKFCQNKMYQKTLEKVKKSIFQQKFYKICVKFVKYQLVKLIIATAVQPASTPIPASVASNPKCSRSRTPANGGSPEHPDRPRDTPAFLQGSASTYLPAASTAGLCRAASTLHGLIWRPTRTPYRLWPTLTFRLRPSGSPARCFSSSRAFIFSRL